MPALADTPRAPWEAVSDEEPWEKELKAKKAQSKEVADEVVKAKDQARSFQKFLEDMAAKEEKAAAELAEAEKKAQEARARKVIRIFWAIYNWLLRKAEEKKARDEEEAKLKLLQDETRRVNIMKQALAEPPSLFWLKPDDQVAMQYQDRLKALRDSLMAAAASGPVPAPPAAAAPV